MSALCPSSSLSIAPSDGRTDGPRVACPSSVNRPGPCAEHAVNVRGHASEHLISVSWGYLVRSGAAG